MEPQTTSHRRTAVVVIPTYNEKENVKDIIEATLAEQQNIDQFDLHILITDSHSQDGTLEVVQALTETNPKVHLLDVYERGIGVGLYKGFHHAIDKLGAEILVEMDADFQHNPADIPKLLAEIAKGHTLVVGSRFVKGSINDMPIHRRILSIGANQVIRLALNLKGVTEITTSFRAFTKELFLGIDPESLPWEEKSFIFVPVLLVKMVESGANVKEIPTTTHPRTRGYSKMNYWSYARDVLLFALKNKFRKG